MDGAPFMPDRQIATRDLREHSRNGETVSNSEFVNSLLGGLADRERRERRMSKTHVRISPENRRTIRFF